MLVWSPLREATQVVEDFTSVGVEDMWSVLVDQDAVVIVVVVGVAADVRALVYDEHLLVGVRGQPLGEHTSCEPGTDD